MGADFDLDDFLVATLLAVGAEKEAGSCPSRSFLSLEDSNDTISIARDLAKEILGPDKSPIVPSETFQSAVIGNMGITGWAVQLKGGDYFMYPVCQHIFLYLFKTMIHAFSKVLNIIATL